MASNSVNHSIDFDKVISKLSSIVSELLDLAGKVTTIANSVLEKFQELNEAGVKLQRDGLKACRDVLELIRAAASYLEKVDAFFYYGQQAEHEIQKAKDDVRTGEYTALARVIDQLKRTLGRAGESYEEFKEKCEKASRSTTTAAEECRRLKNKAAEEGTKTKLIGGALTVVAAGASLLTGGLTSLAMGGVAAATGYGTYTLAQRYEQAENLFSEIGSTLNNVERMVITIEDDVETVDISLQAVARAIDDMEIEQQKRREVLAQRQQETGNWFTRLFRRKKKSPPKAAAESEQVLSSVSSLSLDDSNDKVLIWSVNHFFEKLNEGHSELASAKSRVQEKRDKLRNMIDNLP